MNQTRAMLLLGDPVGDLDAFKPEGGRIKYFFGGGGSPPPAPTSQTVSNTNIPPELMPYATANLASASALTDINQNPYQQYGGNRIAGFNPLQTQSLNSVQNMQASPAIGAGMGMAGAAGIGSLNANYNAQNFGNQYGSGPQFQNMGLAPVPGMGAQAAGAGAVWGD
jgi:hypothetical protein